YLKERLMISFIVYLYCLAPFVVCSFPLFLFSLSLSLSLRFSFSPFLFLSLSLFLFLSLSLSLALWLPVSFFLSQLICICRTILFEIFSPNYARFHKPLKNCSTAEQVTFVHTCTAI